MSKLTRIAIIIACALVAGSALAQHDHAGVETAIDALAAKYMEGWAAADAAKCAEIYTEDADDVDFFGKAFHGRAAIAESIAATLGEFPGTTIEIKRTSLHMVNDSLVVSDGEWHIAGSAPEGAPTSGFYTIIATNAGGEWLITSGRAKVAPPMPNQ